MKKPNSFKFRPAIAGFSLVELIAVVTIIGLLAAMLVSKVKDTRAEAIQSRADANARIMQDAYERAKLCGAITNDYPAVTDFASILYTNGFISGTNYQGVNVLGTYPDLKFTGPSGN